MTPIAAARTHRDRRLLQEAMDPSGRYDARKLAGMLEWSQQEIAKYLDTNPSVVSRAATSLVHQDALAHLAAVVSDLVELFDGNLGLVRTWLRTPIRSFDEKSPKEEILRGRLARVRGLLRQVESGFAV
jgi:hypothetical protein